LRRFADLPSIGVVEMEARVVRARLQVDITSGVVTERDTEGLRRRIDRVAGREKDGGEQDRCEAGRRCHLYPRRLCHGPHQEVMAHLKGGPDKLSDSDVAFNWAVVLAARGQNAPFPEPVQKFFEHIVQFAEQAPKDAEEREKGQKEQEG
jgi:hypothetical protein